MNGQCPNSNFFTSQGDAKKFELGHCREVGLLTKRSRFPTRLPTSSLARPQGGSRLQIRLLLVLFLL